MTIKIIEERLARYKCQSRQEEENALREITQEVALNALFNQDFFKVAAFQGGTCLRIFYSLNRFSEDLDFALINPDPHFDVAMYLATLSGEFEAFGYNIQIVDRSKLDQTVKKVFLKDDSIGELLNLEYPMRAGQARSIRIKFEIDTNPPSGAEVENKFHDFPLNFAVTAHTLPSLFAGKSHSLLCREYIKGRDWYDFLWYAAQKTDLNYTLLSNALNQTGPWKGQTISVDKTWYLREMKKKIVSMNWKEAADDVRRFLKVNELKSLELWSKEFFLSRLEMLAEALS